MKPLYRKKKFIIPVILIALIAVGRIMLEPVLLKKANNELAGLSDVFEFHIGDLDIRILKGAIGLSEITGKDKKTGKEFVSVADVETSIAWRELFKGRVLADVAVSGAGLNFSQALVPKFKSFQKEMKEKFAKKEDEPKKDEKEKEAVRVASLVLTNSSVTFADYPSLKPGESPHLSNIEASVKNLTPIGKAPTSSFDLTATVLDAGKLRSEGELNLLAKPMKWSVDGELLDFDLSSANRFLKKKVPMTFTKGVLDLYAEAKSEDGKIEGYVKPFAENVDMMRTNEDFKGPKHWIIELITATGNFILHAPDKKSVATRIPFEVEGKTVDVDKSQGILKAIQHGFQEKLEKGIEDKFKL